MVAVAMGVHSISKRQPILWKYPVYLMDKPGPVVLTSSADVVPSYTPFEPAAHPAELMKTTLRATLYCITAATLYCITNYIEVYICIIMCTQYAFFIIPCTKEVGHKS